MTITVVTALLFHLDTIHGVKIPPLYKPVQSMKHSLTGFASLPLVLTLDIIDDVGLIIHSIVVKLFH